MGGNYNDKKIHTKDIKSSINISNKIYKYEFSLNSYKSLVLIQPTK